MSGLDIFIDNFDFRRNQGTLKAKLLGYSVSRVLVEDQLAMTFCGTPVYMAPEIIDNKEYNSSCDVWSLGIMLFQMLNGYLPFEERNRQDILEKIKLGTYEFRTDVSVSDLGRDFIRGCLQYEVEDRFTWQQIFANPYLKPEILIHQWGYAKL